MNDSERTYRKSFRLDSTDDESKEIAKAALQQALENRKFEIELYWHRAAYFWALIAVAFAGYFAILSQEKMEDKEFFAFLVACVGLLFTWGWFLVNRGSKSWQENWENHVYKLEDAFIGRLFKTVLTRQKGKLMSMDTWITGPLPISVTKINQWVSTFTLLIWVFLLYQALPTTSVKYVVAFGLTLMFGCCMIFFGRTHRGMYEHVLTKQESTIL